MYILGISAFFHDSAAALICDGAIISAAHEERFTRLKADGRFPVNAINFCLKEAGIKVGDLDYVVFYEKPFTKFERILETALWSSPKGFESFREAIPLWAIQKLDIPNEIFKGLGDKFTGRLLFTNHHESHAASAFFPSPFFEAGILTLDGVGEWGTSSLGVGRGNKIDLTHEMRYPHSLGMLYSAFTYYTGFKVNSGEYKVMGLAPYGQPIYKERILKNLVDVKEDGSIILDMTYFNFCHGLTMTSGKFHELFGGAPRLQETPITQKEMDLAASIQAVCEMVVMRAACHLHRMTKLDNLVMAGGIALNCVANGKLLAKGPYKNIWVQPSSGDAGGALGSALLVWHHFLGNERVVLKDDSQAGSFLGPQYDQGDIKTYLDSVGANYDLVEAEDDLLGRVASLIADEKIIGFFHGRMEFGPRSLGARSILGDPRSINMQQTMNLKIKFRESFRPFAPCVLQEFASTIFELPENTHTPYMQFVASIRKKYRLQMDEDAKRKSMDSDLRVRLSVPRSTLPAITHVDYSARVQTVDPLRHGRLYKLMKHFYAITGCPVIVNTSFNIRGEPIVCNFEDAYKCFMATDIDCLVLENFILIKENQDIAQLKDAYEIRDQYKKQYTLD